MWLITLVEILNRLFGASRIYMDYAAATPVLPEALKVVQDTSMCCIGNPGGLHREGVQAAEVLQEARTRMAKVLGCRASQVVFTSGGTEGNNLAILGAWSALKATDSTEHMHAVTSAIEHPSVLECFREIERRGGTVTYLQPDSRGIIRPEALAEALTAKTRLVSVGWVNSEIGVVQPVHALAKVIREHEKVHGTDMLFHIDAGQGPLYFSPITHGLGVDVMTLDSGKLYGPRGVGVLFIKDRSHIQPLLFGGGQESGMRPGSENVALAAGFAEAFSATDAVRREEYTRLSKLKADFVQLLQKVLPDAVVNGDQKHAAPHIVNISIPRIDSEWVCLALDHAGIALSTKSSCREGEKRSEVVAALSTEPWRAENTLRFSFGLHTTGEEISRAVTQLAQSVQTYRTL